MVMRIWRTSIDESRADEYERFARHKSVPMFSAQAGFVGVWFTASPGRRAVVTFWETQAAAEALEGSGGYRRTVAAIEAAGFLEGASTVEVLELDGSLLTEQFWSLISRVAITGG